MESKVLHVFRGVLHLKGVPRGVPIEMNNVLLRGSTLRNTSWALGLVVYVGVDTKMLCNSSRSTVADVKRSHVEITANRLLTIVFLLLGSIAALYLP